MAGKAAHVAADVLCCPVALRLPGLRADVLFCPVTLRLPGLR